MKRLVLVLCIAVLAAPPIAAAKGRSGGDLEVAEVSYGGANVAVVSSRATNVDVVRAVQQLRLRGSP